MFPEGRFRILYPIMLKAESVFTNTELASEVGSNMDELPIKILLLFEFVAFRLVEIIK
jgi:hypothetical protein